MKRICALLLLCCTLSGCGGRQLEEELLVIVLAVDQTDTGETRLAVKMPGSKEKGNAGEESGGDEGYLLLEATGRDFSDAFTLLNVTTPRKLNFSQVREILIGDAAARDTRLALLLQQIDALPRFRCSAAVIVCRGEAYAFAQSQKPYVGTRLSRYAEASLSNYADKGFIPNTSLCVGVRDMGYGFQDPLFIAGAMNDFSHQDDLPADNALDALPGQLPRKSANAIEVYGAAATDGISVSGYLTGYEMVLVNLLWGRGKALTLHQTEDVPLDILPARPALLQADLSRRPAVLRVQAACIVHYPPGFPPDEEALKARLTRDIADTIRHLQALRCDGVGFADAAVRQFLTLRDWEALSWREVYTAAQIEVSVELTCAER